MKITDVDQNRISGCEQEPSLGDQTVQESSPLPVMETLPAGNLPAVAASPDAQVAPVKKDTRYKPGQSGNPSGRPKRTKEEKDAMERIRSLAPKAVERLKDIIEDDNVSRAILLKAIEIIFDRAYGKPEAAVRVTSVQETLEESEAYVMAVVQRARKRLMEETGDEG